MIGVALVAATALAGADPAIPAPVRAFLERLRSCAHWAGEEPYDPDRARQIATPLRKGRCAAIARDEGALRRRYAARPDVLRLIEASEAGE